MCVRYGRGEFYSNNNTNNTVIEQKLVTACTLENRISLRVTHMPLALSPRASAIVTATGFRAPRAQSTQLPLNQPSTLSPRAAAVVSASRHPSCSADQLRLALYTQRSRSAPLRLTSDGASPLTRRRNAVLMLVGPCCTDVKDACTDGVDVALSRELLGHERQI